MSRTQIIESVEGYAKRTGKLHPDVVEVLQPHFPGIVLASVEVQIHSACWWKSSPCVVTSGRIHFPKGVLNKDQRWDKGNYKGTYFDLAYPGGMALLGHEIVHVQQWHDNPNALVRQNLNAITRVVLEGDKSEWWDSPFEQEARKKQQDLVLYFLGHRAELKRFEELR